MRLQFPDNALFGRIDEVHDVANFLAVGNLVVDLQDSIKDAVLSVENQTISVCDVFLHLIADAVGSHHRVVDAAKLNGRSASDDIGWYIP